MKKWYDEEYKFEIEVTDFSVATILKDIAETARR